MIKLDILLNGEAVDALSLIVHRDKAYQRGRSIAENLEVIPGKCLPIQAAIGNRIVPLRLSERCAGKMLG